MSEEELFRFVHGDKKQFIVKRDPPRGQNSLTVRDHFRVYDPIGLLHGEIEGNIHELASQTILFDAGRIDNLQKGKPSHVPGLITAVIAEIVDRGVITRWSSSPGLTDGGEIVYARLSDDKRLRVLSPSSPNANGLAWRSSPYDRPRSYIVTKRRA